MYCSIVRYGGIDMVSSLYTNTNTDLLDYVGRCLLMGEKPCIGGLRFDIKGDKLVVAGLDTYGLENNDLHMDNVDVDIYLTLTLPFDYIEVNWRAVVRDYQYLAHIYLKLSKSILERCAGLVVNGLKEFDGFDNVDCFDFIELKDADKLRNNAFRNIKISELVADKVTCIDPLALCNVEIAKISLNNLSLLGRKELSALGGIKCVKKLELAYDYKIADEGLKDLHTKYYDIYKFISINKFRVITKDILYYLFCTRETVLANNIQEIGANSDWRYEESNKKTKFLSMNSLKTVEFEMFINFSDLHVYLNDVKYVKGYGFCNVEAPVISLKNCAELDTYAFYKCKIEQLYLPSLKILDLASFQAYSNIKHILIGEHTQLLHFELNNENNIDIQVLNDLQMQHFEKIYN